MAKILAFTSCHPGHLFPFVPLMLELRARGHEVVIGAESFGDGEPSVEGIPVRQKPAGASLRAVREIGRGAEIEGSTAIEQFVVLGAPSATNLEQLIREEHPDALIVDATLWGGVITAEASGLPWAALAHNPLSFRGTGCDIRGPGLPPPKSWFGKLWYRAVSVSVRTMDDQRLPVINEVRATRRLPPLTHACDMVFRPPLMIANTAEPFEYPRSDWPPSLRLVGPFFWDPPLPVPPWIRTLDDRPLVLVVGSTIIEEPATARAWLEPIFWALATEDVQVVATLPADQLPATLPANVRAERFVPHRPLIERAACVVCHGGWGITQRALAAGVPVVAVPTGYDRFEVARRLEVAEAGCILSVNRLTPDNVRAAVRTALRRRPGAARIGSLFAQTGGAARGAEEFERLLATMQPESPQS